MKKLSIVQEFSSFAMKGNMIDLAVGIIIGGAFGKIVSSLVNDIIMPPVGFLLGGYDFKKFAITLPAAVGKEAVEIHYGLFLNNVLDFMVIAFAIFMIIKMINKVKKQEQAAKPAGPSQEIVLLSEIRDLLKKE